MSEFTHINAEGRAKMVNVGDKAFTDRTAVARGEVIMQPETIEKIKKGAMKKGDVLGVAQVAGIAEQKTWELIPMCHNIFISGCDMDFDIKKTGWRSPPLFSPTGRPA